MTVPSEQNLPPQGAGAAPTIDPRLVRALGNPLRIRLLELLSDRVSLTPAAALKLLGDDGVALSNLAYHLRVLRDCKLVEIAAMADRDGGGSAYRLTPKCFVEDTVWHLMPSGLKPPVWVAALQALTQRSIHALAAGTVTRPGSQFDLLPLALDEHGWRKAIGALGESLIQVEEAHRESVERARSSAAGADSLRPILISLIAFESSPSGDDDA